MKRSVLFIPAVAVLVVIATVALRAADQKASDEPLPLHVSQLLGTRPIGLLGKPLGERMVVQGAMAERVMLANPLAIQKTDGQPTTKPVNIEVSGFDLKAGVGYELEGYESGAFEGEPEWHSPGVQQPFQYRPSFVVTRVVKPAGKQ